jgi:hypothetical protein
MSGCVITSSIWAMTNSSPLRDSGRGRSRRNRNAIGAMQHCAFVVTTALSARSRRGFRSRMASTISGRFRSSPDCLASTSTIPTASASNSPASPRTARCPR